MPPKGNAKKESGRAKKAENEKKKEEVAAAQKENQVAADWSRGSKSTKDQEDKEAKKAAAAARKEENARLLAEEEAAAPSKPKPAAKAGAKKSAPPKPAGPGALAAGGGLSSTTTETAAPEAPAGGATEPTEDDVVQAFSATGIDDALEMLTLVNAKADKASVGQDAAKLEAHPERRFKAAFEAYLERELPISRRENPGLRLQQHRDALFKKFQKSPENPFNQTTVSYDATREDKVAALKAQRARVQERLREKEH